MTKKAASQNAQRVGQLLFILRHQARQLGRDFVDVAGSELKLFYGLIDGVADMSEQRLRILNRIVVGHCLFLRLQWEEKRRRPWDASGAWSVTPPRPGAAPEM